MKCISIRDRNSTNAKTNRILRLNQLKFKIRRYKINSCQPGRKSKIPKNVGQKSKNSMYSLNSSIWTTDLEVERLKKFQYLHEINYMATW